MEHGGNPKVIIEVFLDHVTSAPNRHRQGLGNIFDNDRENGLSGFNDVVSSKMGTVSFEGNTFSMHSFFHSSTFYKFR
jgi:hypothetical protein